MRWVNRRARRDGALFRGRFRSRPVLSLRYRDVLVRYIENNPHAARVVKPGDRYAGASAAHQARTRRPRWLATWWIDEVLARAHHLDPQATYDSLWGVGASPAERALVRERSRRPASPMDDLDDLVGAAAPAVRAWMERRARLADGRGARPALVDPQTVLTVLEDARRRLGPWAYHPKRGPSADLWAIAACGLLHVLAGQTLRGCAAWLRVAPSRVSSHLARHRAYLREPAYATRVADLAAAGLRRAHPGALGATISAGWRWREPTSSGGPRRLRRMPRATTETHEHRRLAPYVVMWVWPRNYCVSVSRTPAVPAATPCTAPSRCVPAGPTKRVPSPCCANRV